MIKDILLYLERDPSHDPVRDFALSMAESLEAHVTGVAFAYHPDISGYMMPNFPAAMLAEMLAENERVARATIERFETATRRRRLSSEHSLLVENEARVPRAYSRLARHCDLSMVMQSDPDSVDNDALIEASLFDSGRPMIVLPYIQKDVLKLDRILCCWDGSRTAARAINDALPFLVNAANVELLIVLNDASKGARDEIAGFDMAKHLARYKVNVDIRTIPAGDIDVTSAILSHAADCSASMIVMGGYGHSRLREFVLGGVTRGILSSMTVPIFMSH
jgi:nucleotide-binding universal stress UspA family protein